jgi:hypothetical protein
MICLRWRADSWDLKPPTVFAPTNLGQTKVSALEAEQSVITRSCVLALLVEHEITIPSGKLQKTMENHNF